MNTNILPARDLAHDLGSSSYRWKNLYVANWVFGVIRRDTSQEVFRCQSDTPRTFTFALYDSAGLNPVDHIFASDIDAFGQIGAAVSRWGYGYFWIHHAWTLRFRGSGYSFLPYDARTHHYLVPFTDGYSYIGTPTYRFYYIRGVTVVSGDIGLEDRRCLVCGREFREGDAVVFKVRKVDEENRQVLVVPVHAECNPHPLDPDLLREHEKMLMPNRGEERFEPNPPGPEEFEVVSVTVEDENTMIVNAVCGDGTALSFPAPVDADEETITRLAREHYARIKRREVELEEKRKRGGAKLKRDWRGFKAKLK